MAGAELTPLLSGAAAAPVAANFAVAIPVRSRLPLGTMLARSVGRSFARLVRVAFGAC